MIEVTSNLTTSKKGMNHYNFFRFHNRFIEFKCDNGKTLKGVVLDPLNSYLTKKPSVVYRFIDENKINQYIEAQKAEDAIKMESLKVDIDITTIIFAFCLPSTIKN